LNARNRDPWSWQGSSKSIQGEMETSDPHQKGLELELGSVDEGEVLSVGWDKCSRIGM